MDKKIVKLSAGKHFSVELADRQLSLFVDGDSGVIFFDEGAGPGRVSGGVLTPEAKPRFVWLDPSVRKSDDDQAGLLEIQFGVRRLPIGKTDPGTCIDAPGKSVFSWVESVNTVLAAMTTTKPPTDDDPPARRAAVRRKSRQRPKAT